MTFSKKLISFLLAVMMVAAICPVQALAATQINTTTATIEKHFNQLKKMATDGKFFTTGDGSKPCHLNSHGSCWNTSGKTYCSVADVCQQRWLLNYVDYNVANANLLPGQFFPNGSAGGNSGNSCYGFANYAMWYIFSATSSSDMYKELSAKSTFTKDNITKLVQSGKLKKGYIIRSKDPNYSEMDAGHSIVFDKIDSGGNGIYVLDCNWNHNTVGNSKIQYHYVAFDTPYFKNMPIAVTKPGNVTVVDQPTTYTITYNANGGTNAPAAQTKTKDVALTLSSTEPTRTGYHFLGWATTSTASSAQYSAGSSYTANANVTLYAVWEAKTYAVRYDANGGTGAPATQNKVHDKTLTLSSVIPHYEGHVFKEWRDLTPIVGTWTETKPTSGVYETGYLYYCYGYEHNNDMTFWYGADKSKVEAGAKENLPTGTSYDAKKLRYITYISSANAGSSFKPASGGTFTANYTNSDGTTGTVQIKNTEMYYKAPVYKQDSGSSVAYQPGGTYTANRDVTLVAVWEEAPATYTISYNGNGGSAPGTQTKTQGSSIRLSTQVPTRTGYTFKGWATGSTAAVAQYQPGDTYTADADLTLYAVWAINSYAITYYDGANILSGSSKNYGESVQIIAGPTKEGYTFKGWATSPTATVAQYQPGDTYTADADLKLYAVWAKNEPITYTVSFNANGGTGSMSAVNKVSGSYTLPACSFTAPTDKQFKGWAASPNGAVITGTYNVTANITFYAIWETILSVDGATLQIGKAVSVREKEVIIPISLSNNTGVAGMNFKIDYDKTRLQLTGFEDAQLTGWMVGVGSGEKANWFDENGSGVNGNILFLKFMVLDTAEDGFAQITVTGTDIVNANEEEVSVTVVSGGVEVISRIPGDTNDDGKISAADVLRLRKYLAGMEVEINLLNADVTGDGKVSAADVLRLRKYLAGMDAVLE